MSCLLEIFGRGLNSDLADLLDRYFWSPPSQSLQQLHDHCQQHPDWPDIRLQLGLAYLRAMQFDEAIEHLSQACRHKADYLPARLALASAYDQKAQPEKVMEHLEIANQTHPGEVPVLFAIGFCLEKLQQPAQAAEYYRDTIQKDPDFYPARERLAAVAVFLENLPEAIEQYQALRDSRPQETWLRSALAHLHYRAGRYAQSVEEFENAIALEPENWSLVDDEVESLVGDGLLREAIERLHTLIETKGSFADLHCRLADLYSQVGDDEAAMEHYRTAMDLQPHYLEALAKLGLGDKLSGKRAAAE